MRLKWPWIAINALGVGGYLKLSSKTWPTPEDHVFNGANAFFFFFVIAPLLLSYIVLNAAVLFVIVQRWTRTKSKAAFKPWLAIVAVWLAAVALDLYMARRIPLTDGSEESSAVTNAQPIIQADR